MSALPSAPAATSNSSWRARLALRFEALAGRTCLTGREHYGPLLVQRPFYPEGPHGACHVYIIHPPGGIVSGDQLEVDLQLKLKAHALLTTPAAGKFYRRRDERIASLCQTLEAHDGTLEWLPQENIYYPHSVAAARTVVRLHGAARFIGWEISCFGLPANQLDLGSGRVRQSFELWHDGRPVLLERLSLDAAMLTARWGLAGRASSGTLLIYPAGNAQLERARELVRVRADAMGDTSLACTLVDNALCCRGIAARVDRLKQAFIELWMALRPELIGRPASPPRIWLT